MTYARLGTSAGLLLALTAAGRGQAQSPDTPAPVTPTIAASGPAAADRFDATRDSVTIIAADSLGLSGGQRKIFFENVQGMAHDALLANPQGGQQAIDAARALVVRETGRKVHFIRQARILFGEMYERRKGDEDLPPGTEDELWRSPRNVASLIDLYRRNPEPSDFELEHAMAPSFKAPR